MIILGVIGVAVLIEASLLLKLKHDVTLFAKFWEKQKNTSQSEVNYIALGDSSAQGLGASRPQKGYVGLLAVHIEQKTGQPVHVVNLSVSGARVEDVIDAQLPRLRDYPINNKTVVTLAIGANNVSSFDSVSFKTQMAALLAQLPKQTIVADVAYFGGGRKRNLEPNVLKANKIIAELTVQQGLRLVRLHEITKVKDSIWTMSADLLHPNDNGYINWYEAFAQALDL